MGLGQGEGRCARPRSREHGYAMAALLVGLTIMAVLMGAALPVWTHHMKREREEELIWRGQQYARAVGLFQRKYANTFPPTIDVLVEQRFLRKKYKDPITNSDFQPIPAGGGVPGQGGVPPPAGAPSTGGPGQRQGGMPTSGFNVQTRPDNGRTNTGAGAFGQPQAPSIGVQGVVSKSKDSSLKIYNGRTKYNEWAFVYLATAQRVGGPPGAQRPGVQPGGGFPGLQPGGGPGRPGGFNPQNPPAGGRPPVPFPPPGSGFPTPGARPPGGPASPFAPPPPMGRPPGV